jgi:hypothetical protein
VQPFFERMKFALCIAESESHVGVFLRHLAHRSIRSRALMAALSPWCDLMARCYVCFTVHCESKPLQPSPS